MKKIFLCIFAIIFAASVFFTAISVSADTVDVSELEELIEYAKTLKETNYEVTSYVWNIFQYGIDDAEDVLYSVNSSQSDIDYAVEDLNRLIEALGPPINVEEPEDGGDGIDKSELEALFTEISTWNRDDYNITDQQWQNFITMVAQARTVLSLEGVTQEDIDLVKSNLLAAMEYLKQNKIGNESEKIETENNETEKKSETVLPLVTETAKATKKTERVTETRPKSTTPFLQGGFIEVNCGSSIAISSVVIVGIIGAAVAIKKKED